MLGYIDCLPDGILQAQEELNDRFCGAMSAKDLEKAMACFWDSPDLVVVLWGNVLRGADAVRSALAQFFAQHADVRLDVDQCTHLPAGDGVIAVGTATYRLRGNDGHDRQIVERWTDLRRQIDGRWVYVLDHATVVPE